MESAFGLELASWRKNLQWVDNLISQGYELHGELNAQSDPLTHDEKKEVFASIKIFSRTYGFDYTPLRVK